MAVRKIVAALASVALVASPTMAAAQTAAPLSPAEETVEGSQLTGDTGFGQVIPLIVIIALVFLIREIVKDRDIGDNPISP